MEHLDTSYWTPDADEIEVRSSLDDEYIFGEDGSFTNEFRTPPGSRNGRAAATHVMFRLRHTTALPPRLILTALELSR